MTPRTRWVVLNFPNNPTGAVCPAAHLQALAEVMRAHPHVWIMSDDMYEHLIHDGSGNATMAAAAPDLAHRVLTISGVSKTYAMTGWRVGFAGGPARLIAAMAKIQGQSTGGVAPVAQAAAAAARPGPPASGATKRSAFAARRARVAARGRGLCGLDCHDPRAAFYVYVSVAGLIGRATRAGRLLGCDEAVSTALLEEAGVAVVHGAAFGMSPYVRLSTAASDASLVEACDRIEAFCADAT